MTCEYFCPPSYDEVLATFGLDILLQVDDRDYQGDTRVLFDDGSGRVGWLQFGWGSCSGCDALQACESQDQVDALAAQLRAEIRWFATRAEAGEFFATHDWEGDYSWHHDEQQQFVSKARALLGVQP